VSVFLLTVADEYADYVGVVCNGPYMEFGGQMVAFLAWLGMLVERIQ
jgi:hypothetical protein